jgi:alpha-L-fucosidase 2
MAAARRFGVTDGLAKTCAGALAAAALSAVSASAQSRPILSYDAPAAKWTEALPIGNGRIGAMVFGGVDAERLQINESTLWGGTPRDYANPDAATHLDEIRRLIFDGRLAEAEALADRVMGRPKLLMPFQPFCDLRLQFPGHARATGYTRDLRLDEAVATTAYTVGDTEYRREVFASYPDQVLVMRITASRPGRLSFSVGLDSPQQATYVAEAGPGSLQLTGQIQPRQNPARSWTGSWETPGMRFAAVLTVSTEGGSVRHAGGRLDVADANAATIVFSNATSFVNFADISGDATARARQLVDAAASSPFDRLKARHVADFKPLFSRVQLRLGEDPSAETTDRRVASFAKTQDPALVALQFAFGRYLLISASRPGGQPANLQGLWNEQLLPPWGSKMTTNINFQMNYWLADTGDLWETQAPLWTTIADLRATGATAARVHYRARGWVVHHNTDLWRAATPVDGAWGLWPMGQVWLANQIWDHYQFTRDPEFLRRQAYPAMKAAAEFVLDTLVPAPDGSRFAGRLVTNPSTSPENRYVREGTSAHLTYAATMDLQLIQELFDSCQRAAAILGVDTAFAAELQRTAARLPPLQIGARGQLQEWIEDYAEVEPTHRHVSHLYALYPGHGISVEKTPALANAARRSLELRGDGGTGWALVWKTALWARLGDAARAYANLRLLLETSTLPNMFALHPPFQIDGNFGGTAAITEMLVQSTPDTIRVLPALPAEWPDGSLTGVRVRGGGRVDITWKAGRLTSLTLSSDRDATYAVTYGDRTASVSVAGGTAVTMDGALRVGTGRP